MTRRPVDLVAVRAKLDRLAELYREGVDVPALLNTQPEDDDVNDRILTSHSVRLHPDTLALARKLADDLRDTPEARAVGGRWGLSAVLRMAVDVGMAELEARAKKAKR